MVHVGPMEGLFRGTATFWKNVSQCNFYLIVMKIGVVIVCCLIMSMWKKGPDRMQVYKLHIGQYKHPL